MQTPDIDMSETHIIGKYGSFECHILSTTLIYICSHPKTSLNSLTPHRNSISGQRGSKSQVSEHESSAPPVKMYGTTSLSWCVFISTFTYEKWLILELANEWIGSLRHIQRYFSYTCDGTWMCRPTVEVGPTVGFPRHRHFVGFFKVPVQAPIRCQPF